MAVCPAAARSIGPALAEEPRRFAFSADGPALAALTAAHDERDAAAALRIPLLLMHATGDETVPVAWSRALAERAPRATYVQVLGGHHQSAQHDDELLDFSVRFLLRELAAARAPGA